MVQRGKASALAGGADTVLLPNSKSFIQSKSFAYFIARAATVKSGGRRAGIIERNKDKSMGGM